MVLWCLFLFAFFLFARKSNLVPDSLQYQNKKFLLRKDVESFGNNLIVHIKLSKTIQFGQRILKLPLVEIPGSVLCPVKAFNKMCKMVPALPSDPLFTLPNKKVVTYYQYQNRLRHFIKKNWVKSRRILYALDEARRVIICISIKSTCRIDKNAW